MTFKPQGSKQLQQFFIYGKTCRCLTILFIFLLCSCRDLVEHQPESIEPTPVLNSLLQAGSPIAAHVSLTQMMDSKPLKGINNATVELFVDEEFVELLHHEEDGWFFSSLIAEPGKSYSFRLQISGFEPVTASTYIPQSCRLLNVHHIAIAGKEEQGETYPAVHFTFENNPKEELFFEALIRLYRSDSYEGTGQLKNIIDPVLLNEGIPLLLFSNGKIKDDQYTMIANYTTGSHTGSNGKWITNLYPLVVEFRSVSRDYYLFTRQQYLYDTGRNPIFGIGANIAFPLYSNVKGGFGIVAGYSSVVSDTIYPAY
jgi:hypothetical protein